MYIHIHNLMYLYYENSVIVFSFLLCFSLLSQYSISSVPLYLLYNIFSLYAISLVSSIQSASVSSVYLSLYLFSIFSPLSSYFHVPYYTILLFTSSVYSPISPSLLLLSPPSCNLHSTWGPTFRSWKSSVQKSKSSQLERASNELRFIQRETRKGKSPRGFDKLLPQIQLFRLDRVHSRARSFFNIFRVIGNAHQRRPGIPGGRRIPRWPRMKQPEHGQLFESPIQKQMCPDARWIDTMYGCMDGCSGTM